MEQTRTIRQIALWALFVVVGYWGLQNLDLLISWLNWGVKLFMPFIIGGVLAFILHVPMKFFAKKLPNNLEKGRTFYAFALSIVSVIAVIAFATGIVVPQLAITITEIVAVLPGVGASVLEFLQNIGERYPTLQPTIAEWAQVNWQSIVEDVLAVITTSGLEIVNNFMSAASGIFDSIVNGIVSVIFCIYILFGTKKLARQGKMLLYAYWSQKRADRTIEIAKRSERVFSNFLTGQCLEACILGVIVAVVMFVFRMPYIPLVGVLVAFTALIPLVGAFLGCFIGAFLILLEDPLQALLFIVLFVVIQQLEGNIIYPRVVGSSIGLPSMWVLVAITIGGGVGGVAGMLIMIPLCSVLYSILCETVYARLNERKMMQSFLEERQEQAGEIKKQETKILEKPKKIKTEDENL